MTTPIHDHARRHGGWSRRRRQGRETLHRTAEAPEPAVTVTEPPWLDDGGAAEERSDRVSFRRLR